MDTVIYLIRHSEQYRDYIYTSDLKNERERNKRIILSVNGEEKAKKLSEISELKKIDILFSSDFSRAMATAKYIAKNNNLAINIDERLGERNIGIIDKANIKDNKSDFTRIQLLDPELKNISGESNIEVKKRMQEIISEILNNNKKKKTAIVSHGAAMKFYLLSYCDLNDKLNLEYKGKELEISSPCLLKLTFRENKLVNLEQIRI